MLTGILLKDIIIAFFFWYNSLLKHFGFADFLLIKGNEQIAPQNELGIAPFEKRFKQRL